MILLPSYLFYVNIINFSDLELYAFYAVKLWTKFLFYDIVQKKEDISNMRIYHGENDYTNYESNSFLQVNHCGMCLPSNQKTITTRKNGRVDYQLLYLVSGHLEVKYDKKKYQLTQGFVIYPPNMPQKYVDYEDTQRIWVHFTGTNVEEILEEYHLKPGVYTSGNSLLVKEMFLQLIVEYTRSPLISNEKGMLLSILSTLGKLVNNVGNISNDKINEAITFITMHYNTDVSIKELANSCNLSQSRFMYLFKEQTGMAPHAYLQALRIKNSMTLLTSTQLKIVEVGKQCGYEDSLYFSRVFKKHVGVSPREYRRQNTDEQNLLS